MTLIVKMMSGENLADDDSRKSYVLKSGVLDVEFVRCKDHAEARMSFNPQSDPATGVFLTPETVTCLLSGNCYVMNEAGKTVSSFGIAGPNDDTGDGFVAEMSDEVRNGSYQCCSATDAEIVVSALDTLGLALVGHHHHWTKEERRLYERACRLLFKKNSRGK